MQFRNNEGRVHGNSSTSIDPLKGVGTRPVKREKESSQNSNKSNPYTVNNKSKKTN